MLTPVPFRDLDAASFSDDRLASESDYMLNKIYEMEDVFYELQKRINEVGIEIGALEQYNNALSDEMRSRGWF